MLTGIAHVNLTVPEGTLELAAEFYGTTLGMTRVPVPVLQKDRLAWYAIVPCSRFFLPVTINLLLLSFTSCHSPLTHSHIHLANCLCNSR